MVKNKKTQKKISVEEDAICKEFIRKHGVGTKVNGVTLFDIVISNDKVIYAIVPLHEFAQSMNKHAELDETKE